VLIARLEIHPFGVYRKRRTIRTIRIANVADLGGGNCRYLVTATGGGIISGPAAFTHWRDNGAEQCLSVALASLKNHDRLREGERIARELHPAHRGDLRMDP
jgi:hypothetical protein